MPFRMSASFAPAVTRTELRIREGKKCVYAYRSIRRSVKRVQARIARLEVVAPYCANNAIQKRIDYLEAYERDLFKILADVGRRYSSIVDRMCKQVPFRTRKLAFREASAQVDKLLRYAQARLGLRGRLAFGFKH